MDPITAALVNLVIGLVISGVSTLAQQAFAPKPKAMKQLPGMRGQYTTGGTVPQTIVLGTYGVAGQLEYSNTWGNSGETPNAFLVDVISLSDYPVTAVTAQWIDTVEITLPGTGAALRGLKIEDPAQFDGYAWYIHHLGDQTSADAYLLDKFGADSKRPWLSDMIGEGITYAVQTARINEALWTDFPRYMYELQGAPVFDPRESTAAGGSGSQVWGTFSTYAFSDNLAVLALNVLLGLRNPDGDFIWGGRATLAQFDYANLAAAMDRCDELVDRLDGGTERRYRGGIEISLNERPADVLRDIMVAANLRISFARGKYWFLVDEPDSADASFTDGDLLIKEPIDFSWFPDLDSAVNGATATFLAKQRAWEERETTPYYRSDLEAEDHNQLNREKLQLRCVYSASQAQRIIKVVVEQSRKFKRHVVCLPDTYRNYYPFNCLAWTSDEFQYSGKLFLIISRTEDEFGRIWFALQEIDPADFDWDAETDETELTFASTDDSPVPAQAADGFDAVAAVFLDNDGTSRRPGIAVSFAANLDDVRAVRVTVTLDGETANVFDQELTYDPAAVDDILLPMAFLPATDYDVYGQYMPFDGSGRTTTRSAPVSVTTDDIRLGALDIYEGSVIADLPDSLKEWQSWAGDGLRSLIDELKAIAQSARDQDLANYRDVQTISRRLVSTFDTARAEFNESILAATGPGSSIVLQLTELQSQVDDDLATAVTGLTTQIGTVDGRVTTIAEAFTALTAGSTTGNVATANFRMTALAGPSGYSRIGAQTRIGGTGSYRGASWFLDTPTNPALPTRFVVSAQQFIITDGSALFSPFVFESGVAKMTAARIGTITAGKLQNSTGSSYFDLTNNKFRIST